MAVFGSFILGGDVLGKMLADRNWWLPGWLDRLLPNVHVEGHEITADEYDLRDAIGRQRLPADVEATTSA